MKRTLFLCVLAVLLFVGGTAYYLYDSGTVQLNNPSRAQYPVRGVDVSRYQGEIDWPTLAGQDIQFAYIKATEGTGYVDPMYARNQSGVRQTNLRFGFYHFMSYDSPGNTQADNFIRAVPKLDGMLPPAVDVEFYGRYNAMPLMPQQVFPILDALLQNLERHYGMPPVIYCTEQSYNLYIKGRYENYPIWIRSVYGAPYNGNWTFWQYTDHQVLDGYAGDERFIDMNVFQGTAQEFAVLSSIRRAQEDDFDDAWDRIEEAE